MFFFPWLLGANEAKPHARGREGGREGGSSQDPKDVVPLQLPLSMDEVEGGEIGLSQAFGVCSLKD